MAVRTTIAATGGRAVSAPIELKGPQYAALAKDIL
jgi:hypothetical protein